MADSGGDWGGVSTSTPWGSVASPHIVVELTKYSSKLLPTHRVLLMAGDILVDKPDDQPPTFRYAASLLV